MEDTALVRRAAEGDEPAFELIVRRHTDSVWRYARTVLHDDGSAEEAVQDTFLKAHRALATFRGEAALRTWLISICHRACLDRLRRKRLDVVPLEQVREQRGREEQHDLRLWLEQAVAELPDDERQAFTLVHVLGYSREDAAQIVEVPPSTMRSRVSRARERLADAMAGTATGTEGS